MLLSSIIGKKIYDKGKERGVCDGVFLSSKSHTVKYLSCLTTDNFSTHFSLSFSQIDYVTDTIRLKRFCIVLPDKCEKFTLGLPVYDDKGIFVGKVVDLELEKQIALSLITEKGERIPAHMISSCHDAVILKKAPPFPLSRRIPAHSIPLLEGAFQQEKYVTKKSLLAIAKQGNLIKFTLSLSPFSCAPSKSVFGGKF